MTTSLQGNEVTFRSRWAIVGCLDAGRVREAMVGCDTIFHLAADPDIAKAITQPDIDFWEGTYLTQNVLEAMRQTEATRIFYTSGSGVDGEDPAVDFPEEHLIDHRFAMVLICSRDGVISSFFPSH